jgi:hypothetical protein
VSRDHDALTDPPLDRLTAVCPRCRRLVRADRACELDGSDGLELHELASRDRLVEATWGSVARRDELRGQLAQRIGARRARSGVIGYVAAAAIGYAFQTDAVQALLTGLIGVPLGLSFAVARRRILVPPDAAPLPSWPNVVGRGRVVAAREVVAPGTLARCAAWSLELRYQGSWGTRTTLRAGATAGFDVRLDDGDHVRVPAGAIWLANRLAQVDGEDAIVDDLVRQLDPLGVRSPWPLFQFNVIAERTLQADDRVEVLDSVEPRVIPAEPAEAAGLFRDAQPTMLFHMSLPVVRIL